MNYSSFHLTEQNQKIESRIVVALERISESFRVLLWNESKENSLSPIQIQLLIFIQFHAQEKCKVGYLADEFNMTKATISDAIKSLEQKELITKNYIDNGFLISVGGAVTFEKNKKLQDCIKKIPLEYLLVETDSPDQAPEGWQGPNDPTSLYLIAEKIGLIRNISAFDVLEVNTSNFKRLFRL